jgi:hypothetical protein
MGSKKSQFYLLTMIIFCSIVFISIIGNSATSGRSERRSRLYNNYLKEIPFVIDSAIVEEQNITEQLDSYTEEFINYANSKSIRFGVLYILNYNRTVILGNHLDSEVVLPAQGITLTRGNRTSFPLEGGLSIIYRGITYEYNLTPAYSVEYKALMNIEE